MNFKKLGLGMITVIISVSFILAGCGTSESKPDAAGTESSTPAGNGKVAINLYSNGSDNVRLTWESVLEAFKAKNPNIDVKLQFLASGTGGQGGLDRLIAAVKAGQKETDIDLLETDDNGLARILAEAGKDALTPLPADKIPNLKNVTAKSSVGGDNSLVFRGTTVLLAYNSEKVQTPPKTDEELYEWIRKNPGRFAYNDPTTGGAGESFVITSIYNKLPAEALTSTDVKWKEQWTGGFDLLKELHPYMYKASGKVQYPAKNQGTLDLLASGEVDMIPAWADMALDQMSQDLLPKSIKVTQITPSFTGGVVSVVVPSLSKHKEEAYKLMNFAVSPEGQKIFVEKQKAIPVIDNSLLTKETVDMLSGLEVKEFRINTIGKLGDEIKKKWQEDIATLN